MAAIGKHRVKLLTDLTKYDSRLIVGELGWSVPHGRYSGWGLEDRFWAVDFDNGAKLDVLFSGLEVIKGAMERSGIWKSR